VTSVRLRPVILVIEAVEETRQGIERLLSVSDYQVTTAKDERDAIFNARLTPPNLILISLDRNVVSILPVVQRIRDGAGIGESIPVVVFCVTSLEEGAEVEAGYNVYLTRPENFDQLRILLGRLLRNR
jgi:CheY-like chemotaxis protein